MKNIEAVQIWKNGSLKNAEVLDARIINDDLNSSCTFYWMLKEANVETPSEIEGGEPIVTNGQQLAEGNHTISGDDYVNWDGSNDQAFTLLATAINVTLI